MKTKTGKTQETESLGVINTWTASHKDIWETNNAPFEVGVFHEWIGTSLRIRNQDGQWTDPVKTNVKAGGIQLNRCETFRA